MHEAVVQGEGWTLCSRLCRCLKKKWSEMIAELPRLLQLPLWKHSAVWEFTSFSVEGRQGRWCSVDQCVFSTAVSVLSQTSLGHLSFLTQSFDWHVHVLLLSGSYFLADTFLYAFLHLPRWYLGFFVLFCFFLRLVFLYDPRRQVLKLMTANLLLSFSCARMIGVCNCLCHLSANHPGGRWSAGQSFVDFMLIQKA